MEFKNTFIRNLKTPVSVLLSALFATFIFSVGEMFFDKAKYENLIWLFDTTIYSFIISSLIDGALYLVDKQRTLVEVIFYNISEKNNRLVFRESEKYKNIKVYININGKSHSISDSFRIYEPEGVTLQLKNQPDYIDVADGSYYEINLTKLMGIEKNGKYINKKDMQIKRTLEFQVALDDPESEYRDKLYIHRDKSKFSNCLLVSLKQTLLIIER
jgi:hypothetical protein